MNALPASLLTRARTAAAPQVTGVVTGAMGLTLTVDGIAAAVGDLVEINPTTRPLLAEVVAVGRDRLTCMPLGTLSGVHAGAPVRATGMPLQVSRSRPTATTSASSGRSPGLTSTRSPTAALMPSTLRVRPMAPVTTPVTCGRAAVRARVRMLCGTLTSSPRRRSSSL